MSKKERIRQLEENLFRAWPALETRYYDGWVLRFARGFTRRSNSVNPLYTSSLELDRKINFCEALYFERHLDIHFKLTDAANPSELDSVLETRQYHRVDEVRVLECDLSAISPTKSKWAYIMPSYTESWLDDTFRLTKIDMKHMVTFNDMLKRLLLKAGFLQLIIDNQTVGVGMGVVDGALVTLFQIGVDESLRGRGLGRAVVNSLLYWGKSQGAKNAVIQVTLDNVVASHLYESVGFKELYCYWYRSLKTPK